MKNLIPTFLVCALCVATTAYASDEATLNQAMKALNARAKTDADKKLVLTAVSQQTTLPEKTLLAHMGKTQLNYGELLTAESLAQGGRKDINAILAMKRGKEWIDVSKEVKIDPGSIVDRLRAAEKTVQASQGGKPKQAQPNNQPASAQPNRY
jgi:hypothetical protein